MSTKQVPQHTTSPLRRSRRIKQMQNTSGPLLSPKVEQAAINSHREHLEGRRRSGIKKESSSLSTSTTHTIDHRTEPGATMEQKNKTNMETMFKQDTDIFSTKTETGPQVSGGKHRNATFKNDIKVEAGSPSQTGDRPLPPHPRQDIGTESDDATQEHTVK